MGKYYALFNGSNITVVDIESQRFVDVEIDKFRQLGTGISLEALKKTIGTVVFVNNKHSVYGLFTISNKNKPVLSWISISNFDNDPNKQNIYFPNELINVDSHGEEIVKSKWFKGVTNRCVLDLEFNRQKSQDFLIQNKFIIEQVNDCEERETDTKEVESAQETELEFITILGYMQPNDSISIPKAIYAELKPLVKKVMDTNTAYTEYKALVEIKSKDRTKNLIAYIEYKEENQFIRLHVIKSLNSNKVEEVELDSYYRDFMNWRNDKSITFRV